MFKKSTAVFMYNIYPLHAGAGEGMGGIDLPIQREGHTKFPKIEASGIKGAIKESFKRNPATVKVNGKELTVNKTTDEKEYPYVNLVFGPDQGDLHSSSIGFSDARLLLFPVPSLRGTFAWVTCPLALEQFVLDLQRIKPDGQFQLEGLAALNGELEPGEAFVISDKLKMETRQDTIFLQEYPFHCIDTAGLALNLSFQEDGKAQSMPLGTWLAEQGIVDGDYFGEKIKTDIVVLNTDDFRDFVEMDTEVITRIRINSETGIVEQGALFTEEYLPARSVMYSIVSFAPVFMPSDDLKDKEIKTAEDVEAYYRGGQMDYWQIGGNTTLGKGLIRFKILNN